MKWEINFIATYEVEASSKWEAVEIAEQIFNADTHFDYGVDVNPLGYDDDDDDEEEDD
jgi:hypothetical protein